MVRERLTAMEHIAAGVGAELQGLASDATLEAVDSATAGNGDGSRAKLDRAIALRAAIPEIAMHLSAVDQIRQGFGLPPLSVKFLSDLVSAEERPSDEPIPAEVDLQVTPAAPGQESDMPVVRSDSYYIERYHRERLQERYFEAAIARDRDGEYKYQTWDQVLRFVYAAEFSEENRQRLTDDIQSARRDLLERLPDILTTDEISDQIVRIQTIEGRYRRFYKRRSDIVATAGREFPAPDLAPASAPDPEPEPSTGEPAKTGANDSSSQIEVAEKPAASREKRSKDTRPRPILSSNISRSPVRETAPAVLEGFTRRQQDIVDANYQRDEEWTGFKYKDRASIARIIFANEIEAGMSIEEAMGLYDGEVDEISSKLRRSQWSSNIPPSIQTFLSRTLEAPMFAGLTIQDHIAVIQRSPGYKELVPFKNSAAV